MAPRRYWSHARRRPSLDPARDRAGRRRLDRRSGRQPGVVHARRPRPFLVAAGRCRRDHRRLSWHRPRASSIRMPAGAKPRTQAAALRAVLRDYPPLEAPDPDRLTFRSEELHRETPRGSAASADGGMRARTGSTACSREVAPRASPTRGVVRSLRDHDRWFNAVAGASAGAITAVLVAAGFDPDQMESRTREGLQLVRPVRPWMHLLAMFGIVTPIDEMSWLVPVADQGVACPDRSTDRNGTRARTVRHIRGAARSHGHRSVHRGPRHRRRCPAGVMSHHNAPNGDVARAAVASSSIPAAMRSQPYVAARVNCGADGSERALLTKLVDGGAWANYPRFVFSDPSFRVQHLGPGNLAGPSSDDRVRLLRPSGRDTQRPKPRTGRLP